MEPREGLAQQICRILTERAESVAGGASTLLSSTHPGLVDLVTPALADLALELVAAAARDGEADPHGAYLEYLVTLTREKRLPVRRLFALVYLLERCALDELAHEPSLASMADSWPRIEQALRRSSFDVLAAYAERLVDSSGADALIDARTSLHSRGALLSALEKELQRAARRHRPFALLFFNIDRLSEINRQQGFEVGDLVLERVGVVIRTYVRDQDWVARVADDTFGVLLTETTRDHVEHLAERVRRRLDDRVSLRDDVSGQVRVTVRMAIVVVENVACGTRAEHVLGAGERAVHAAKHMGPRYVERVVIGAKTPAGHPDEPASR